MKFAIISTTFGINFKSASTTDFGSRPATTSATKGHVKSASVSSPGPSNDSTTSTQTDPLRQRLEDELNFIQILSLKVFSLQNFRKI